MGTDRKRPLAAFLVVAVIAVVLLVTSVRSQAASGWLNRRLPASVVAVVPGAGESQIWHAVGDSVTQVVRHGAQLVHKTAPDVSSGDTTVADPPPSLVVSTTPATPHARLSPTHRTRHHARHHAAHHQPVDVPGSGGPGAQPGHDVANDQGTAPIDPAVDTTGESDGSGHHGRDHGDGGDRHSNASGCGQGEHGDGGDQGSTGDQGDQGSTGDQGDQGSTGDQSDQGSSGDQNSKGDGLGWFGGHGHGHGHGHGDGHGRHLGWGC